MFLTSIAAVAFVASAQAAIVQFDLTGIAGAGLRTGNEPGMVTGGSGGEIGAGISYDNVANMLTLNVGWGSANGFVNLSSAANNSHIHGPTAHNFGNDGTGNFKETTGVLFNLTRSSDALTGGAINQVLTLSEPQEVDLLNGRFYLNLHTVNNAGGEIRGFLVPVPEPGAWTLAALGVLALLGVRRSFRV